TWQLYSGRHGCPAWKYGRASSCALRWMFAISLPHLRRSSASRLRASARPPCRRCAEVISSIAFSSGGIFSMTFFSFSEPLSPLILPHALHVFRKMKNAAGLCTLRRSAALPETWGSPWFRTSVGPLSAERDKKYPAGLILAALDADTVGFCHRPVVEAASVHGGTALLAQHPDAPGIHQAEHFTQCSAKLVHLSRQRYLVATTHLYPLQTGVVVLHMGIAVRGCAGQVRDRRLEISSYVAACLPDRWHLSAESSPLPFIARRRWEAVPFQHAAEGARI